MCKWLLLFVGFILISCGSRETLAPVSEPMWSTFNSHAAAHRVRPGDTLYSIAFLYDADYKQLARINQINAPYRLAVGQIIKLHANQIAHKSQPHYQPVIPSKNTVWHANNNSKWLWPIKGPIRTYFSPQMGRKGLDISGKAGMKICAAQGGVVAYSGKGPEHYGNLVIIKHNNDYLTAYGNNSRNLVKEGQYVKPGQTIAEIGVIGRQYYGLHFEIRKKGQPLNPLTLLGR